MSFATIFANISVLFDASDEHDYQEPPVLGIPLHNAHIQTVQIENDFSCFSLFV